MNCVLCKREFSGERGYIQVTENFARHYPDEVHIFCQTKCLVEWFN